MTKGLCNTDVLIVGGGPAGLTLARSCEENKVDYMLVEKNQSASTYSKATGLHANSMKILNEFGLSDEVIDSGVRLDKNIIIYNHKIIKEIIFPHGNTPYELNFSISQEKLENIISHSLDQSCLFYNHRFQGWNEDGGTICCKVRDGKLNMTKLIKAKIMVAADGGKSTIRRKLKLNFEGETNPALSFSFDAKILTSLQPHCMFTISNQHGRIVVVPLGNGIYKISGQLTSDSMKLDAETLVKIVYERSSLIVEDSSINGLTTYHTHSRRAPQFKIGSNIFLIGDAAHVFYPSGGYGLNMAIRDAYILGGILKEYFRNHDNALLDSFANERMLEAIQIQEDAVKKRAISVDTSLKEVVVESFVYNSLHQMCA